MIDCLKCSGSNPSGHTRCRHCGAFLPVTVSYTEERPRPASSSQPAWRSRPMATTDPAPNYSKDRGSTLIHALPREERARGPAFALEPIFEEDEEDGVFTSAEPLDPAASRRANYHAGRLAEDEGDAVLPLSAHPPVEDRAAALDPPHSPHGRPTVAAPAPSPVTPPPLPAAPPPLPPMPPLPPRPPTPPPMTYVPGRGLVPRSEATEAPRSGVMAALQRAGVAPPTRPVRPTAIAAYGDAESTTVDARAAEVEPTPAPTPTPAPPPPPTPPPPPARPLAPTLATPIVAPARPLSRPVSRPASAGRLLVLNAKGEARETFALPEGRTILGRTDGELLLPDDPAVSPWHAWFEVRGASVAVRDLRSRNGIFRRLRGDHLLADGERLILGAQVFTFHEGWSPDEGAGDGTVALGAPGYDEGARLLQWRLGGQLCGVLLLREGITLGRTRGDVSFPQDSGLDAEHAVFRRLGERYGVIDLGTRRGIFVGLRPGEHTLEDGDELLIGQTRLRFLQSDDAG